MADDFPPKLVQQIADYLTSQFVWPEASTMPKDECLSEARHVLALSGHAELVAALELSRPFVRIATSARQAGASTRWYDKAMAALARIDAALAAEPASEEVERPLSELRRLAENYSETYDWKPAPAVPPPPPAQGEEENIEKIVARFEVEHAKVGELCSVMPNTHIRALIASWRKRGDENAALRQRADEATRNENIGCAALVERLLQRTYPMDSAYEPIVAAIRARIAKGEP